MLSDVVDLDDPFVAVVDLIIIIIVYFERDTCIASLPPCFYE